MEQGAVHPKSRKKSKKPHHATREAGSGTPAQLLKHTAIGAGIALAVAAALALIAAGICYSTPDPNSLTLPVGMVLPYLSALVGGFAAVRLHRSAPLPCGLLCGGFLALFFLFLTLFFEGESGIGLPLSIILRVLIPAVSVLGALLGLKRKSGSRRRSR
ncbi:MAG: TIGR04086 family membrane protein [Clostridia bacterium]|nr:TIGR04086 family membrane protein [Clostridia bacterium]